MKFIDDAIKESEESVENNNTLPETAEDDLDNELIEIIKQSRAKITVVGTGGAGNNTISRLNEIGIEGARTITVNTDAQDLFYSRADKKLLLGRQICGGLGAGGEPTVGEEIIAIGGTGHGVDTAVVMTAANMTNVFDMKFHEIIAMPR